MNNIKSMRIVDSEGKSVREFEKEIVANAEANVSPTDVPPIEMPPVDVPPTDIPPVDAPPVDVIPVELNEQDVLSFISKRYDKPINSFDELMNTRSETEELPEDVSAYLKFKKETGRGFDDFIKVNRDIDAIPQKQLLRDYYKATQHGLDDEDIDVLMEDFSYDEELDDESTIRKIKLEEKKAVALAKKFFTDEKEKYRMPLESRSAGIPDTEKEEFEAYKQYISSAKTVQEEEERKRQWFQQKTDEVFGGEFKGFEFNIDDRKLTFAPGDATELKKNQLTPMNFIGKYLDEDGLMKDAAGYHRSLAIAMNPDRFAKFFYEQGKADATDDVLRKTKNINMTERKAPEVINKGGMQIRVLNDDSGRLKIKSPKKV
jgi:hypothetical protein